MLRMTVASTPSNNFILQPAHCGQKYLLSQDHPPNYYPTQPPNAQCQCHPPFTQEKEEIIKASPILKQMMPQSPPLMSISILQVDSLISSTSPQPLQLICTLPQAAHGCDKSLTSDIRPHQTLQPHDSVCGNTNRKKKELTTIYTQNSQGLWRRPRDAEGNILVDHPPRSTQT